MLAVVATVAVMGDERTYAYPIVEHAVTSDDAMTAGSTRLPTTCLSGYSGGASPGCRGQRVAADIM